MTRVVHCKVEPYDVYIGRKKQGYHYGNPFRLLSEEAREDCIQSFREWLMGTAHQHIEPDRRVWILETLESLKGKVLGCWCKPKACHGDVLVELIDRRKK